jgi:hypothetical protein
MKKEEEQVETKSRQDRKNPFEIFISRRETERERGVQSVQRKGENDLFA